MTRFTYNSKKFLQLFRIKCLIQTTSCPGDKKDLLITWHPTHKLPLSHMIGSLCFPLLLGQTSGRNFQIMIEIAFPSPRFPSSFFFSPHSGAARLPPAGRTSHSRREGKLDLLTIINALFHRSRRLVSDTNDFSICYLLEREHVHIDVKVVMNATQKITC